MTGDNPVASEALAVSLEIANEWWRDRALRALMPLLAAQQLPRVLAAARALPTLGTRARSLARMAAFVPSDERAALAAEALAVGAALPDAADQARVAVLAAGSLPQDRRAQVAQAALPGAVVIADPWERGVTVAELAAHVPAAERLVALAHIRAIADLGARANALAAIAGRLPEHLEDTVLDEAVSVASGIEAAEGRARALAGLAGALNPEQAAQVARAALDAADAADDDLLWARVWRWAGTRLPGSAHAAALPRALGLGAADARAEVLPALVAHLPEPQKTEAIRAAIAAIGQVGDEWARVSALAWLAPHLPTVMQPAALSQAAALADPWARADAISALAPYRPPDEQVAAVQAALAAARSCANAWPRARALTTVAARLPAQAG